MQDLDNGGESHDDHHVMEQQVEKTAERQTNGVIQVSFQYGS